MKTDGQMGGEKMTGETLKCDDGGGQGHSTAESLGGINDIEADTYSLKHTLLQ